MSTESRSVEPARAFREEDLGYRKELAPRQIQMIAIGGAIAIMNLVVLTALGIISAWAVIVAWQLEFWSLSKTGAVTRPAFRLFGAPYTGYATLGFLACVLVLMAFDKPVGTWTVASILLIAPTLIGGWFLCRKRIREVAARND